MTDMTAPVAALLQDLHALINKAQATADQLQYWLNAASSTAAAPVPAAAPVVAAPVVAAPVVAAPAKRGRKPKEKHAVLEALTRMAKGWPAKTDLADSVVLLTPDRIRTLPNAKIYWDYPCNTGLTSGRAAMSGRELLDVMKRAGANAQLTASADSQSLQVEGDVTVRLRAQGGFTADAWDEQAASLQHRPPTKVLAHGVWSRATCEAAVAASSVCSKDATRPTLTNVLFDKAGYVVATDGHRLDVRPIHHDGESLLVPASVMPVLATCESSVFWEVSDTHIRLIDADGVAFTFPRSTEQFPNWRHVMPRKDNTETFAISVDREALLLRSKVKPAGLPYWHCHLIDNELQVEEHGVDGATKFTLPVSVLERPDGDRCLPRFGLNYTYVRDMCEGSDSKYITLFVEDQLAPILCSTAVTYGHAVSLNAPAHLIMPVRI
jgi:hypothetical protein